MNEARVSERLDNSSIALLAHDQHFTVQQVAATWGVSEDLVRELFQDEAGVLQITNPKRGRRRYVSLRIPKSVVERVHRKMMCG
jgi:hypothetical protein